MKLLFSLDSISVELEQVSQRPPFDTYMPTTVPSCSPAYTRGPLVYTPHRDYPLLRIRMDGVSMSLVMETVEINEPFANPTIGFSLFLF